MAGFSSSTASDSEGHGHYWRLGAVHRPAENINAARGSYFSIGGTLTSAHRSNGHDEGLFARSGVRGVQELRLFVRRPAA
jgi:hypothetical protein